MNRLLLQRLAGGAVCVAQSTAVLHQTGRMSLCMSHLPVSGIRGPLQVQCRQQQQYWQPALCSTRPGLSVTHGCQQQRALFMTHHHINVDFRKPVRLLLPVRAEAGAGGGSGSNSGGGKKGYSSGGDGSSSSGSGGLWEAYVDLLQKHPLLVKAVTTALLSAIGNLICQLLVEGKSDLDWKRFNTFTALGFVWVAPCLHFWFGALNKLVTNPGNAGALMRMGLDQLGFAPLFIGSMIAILATLDGKSLEQSLAVVRRDLPDAIKANWALWVPAQFINFRYVPASYQVLFANMVALVWNVYFSFATRPKTA